MRTLTEHQVYTLSYNALTHHGCSTAAANSLALSIKETEKSGISSHGLLYLPIYCQHLACGKVAHSAKPTLNKQTDSSFRVDADQGFAHPAIDLGFKHIIPAAKKNGIAALSIHQSYNCGVLGYHVNKIAEEGLVGLGFTNSPASIAPIGGKKPVIGTNPFALGVPNGEGGAAFIMDQSASVVAKSEIMKRAQNKQEIPSHWAFDTDGCPTTDPQSALKGSMAPSGGYKGFGVGLMVEVFAAVLSGATLGKDASPFSGEVGGPPKTGQFFIAINPETFSGGSYLNNLSSLCAAIESQENARLPGQKRQQFYDNNEPIQISEALFEKVSALTDS